MYYQVLTEHIQNIVTTQFIFYTTTDISRSKFVAVRYYISCIIYKPTFGTYSDRVIIPYNIR